MSAGQGWHRFRSDDADEWRDREDWPAGEADVILVYNSCDGYHLWRRGFDEHTPPGAHWCHLLDRPKVNDTELRMWTRRMRLIAALQRWRDATRWWWYTFRHPHWAKYGSEPLQHRPYFGWSWCAKRGRVRA